MELRSVGSWSCATASPDSGNACRRDGCRCGGPHVEVHVDGVSFDGTVRVDAEVDLADASDLEDAIRAGAAEQARLGSKESLDVRRAKALGDLARRQLAFGFDTEEPDRAVDLVVHISEDALTGTETVGRCGNTRSPISVEQVREWCGNPNAKVTVKPVVDLADHIHVEAYEAPDRLKDQNALVDVRCVFPRCTKPARRCDTDHVVSYPRGQTSSTNTAPLCVRTSDDGLLGPSGAPAARITSTAATAICQTWRHQSMPLVVLSHP